MKPSTFTRFLGKFPDERTLLHCLQQIACRHGGWAGELAEALEEPGFNLKQYFCEYDSDGPYLDRLKITTSRLAFDYGECYGGLCGHGNRYVFRLLAYDLDEEETPVEGWIH